MGEPGRMNWAWQNALGSNEAIQRALGVTKDADLVRAVWEEGYSAGHQGGYQDGLKDSERDVEHQWG